jgi:hypothetical protein
MSSLKAEPVFSFRKSDHTYWLGDRRLPGSTELLRAGGLIDNTAWYNEAALIRGRNVHIACAYLAEGDLNWDTLKLEIRGYVEAYEKAVEELNFIPGEIESPVYHAHLGFATIPDQVGEYQNSGKLGILELKSGVMQHWTAIQTAFQSLARFPGNYYGRLRVGLELHRDGTYRTESYTDVGDFDVAMSLLNIWRYKQKYHKTNFYDEARVIDYLLKGENKNGQ